MRLCENEEFLGLVVILGWAVRSGSFGLLMLGLVTEKTKYYIYKRDFLQGVQDYDVMCLFI